MGMSIAAKVLVVEDDAHIRRLLRVAAERVGYRVGEAATAREGLSLLDIDKPDIVLLDLGLPDRDGIELIQLAKVRGAAVMVVSARDSTSEKVAALDLGADDYITKPFEPRELVARVRSVLRRAYTPIGLQDSAPARRAVFQGWTLDFENRRLSDPKGRVVILSGNEFSLLRFFVEHANEVLTREQLLTLTSNPTLIDGSPQRVADLQISRLRQKLDDDARASQLIMTVRGQGYVLAAAVTFE